MRQRKYRAWDGEQMHYSVISLVFNHDTITHATVLVKGIPMLMRGDNVVFEEFTGQTDKNKKEIYKADLVKGKFARIAYPVDDELYEVYWDEDNCAFRLKRGNGRYWFSNFEWLEVITNIHENKK